MKHILATLLTVFCLFTAGLVARSSGSPGAAGEAGGTGGAATCGSGYSSAVGTTYTYDGYDLTHYRSVYPGFQLCIDNTTGNLVVINDSGRTDRIITQD